MRDRCDHCGYHGNCDHIVSRFFYQPSNDDIKESGIRQNTKINDGKDK